MSDFTAVPMTDKGPYPAPIGWSPPGQPVIGVQPTGRQPSPFDNLAILQQYNEFVLQPDVGGTIYAAQILDGNGHVLFNVDRHFRRSRYRRGMGGASMNVLNPAGQILFNCDREEYESTVTAPGEVPLGDIDNSVWTRNFDITNKTNGSKIVLVPTGSMGGSAWCAFNACLMNEYSMESNGNVLGSIRCAPKGSSEGHRIRFDSQVDVQSKALILSAALVIGELYFQKELCGNVGLVGRTRIVLFLCLAMLIPAGIFAYFFERSRSG